MKHVRWQRLRVPPTKALQQALISIDSMGVEEWHPNYSRRLWQELYEHPEHGVYYRSLAVPAETTWDIGSAS